MNALDELNRFVTAAIIRAEGLDRSGKSAACTKAWAEVSELEERIAELVPADELEGAIARLGVVTAAMAAHQPRRARDMATKYIDAGGLPAEQETSLRAELAAALDDIEDGRTEAP